MPLSSADLLRAVTALARELQRLPSVERVLEVAGRGLEALGFDLVVLGQEQGRSWVRYASDRPPLSGLVGRLKLRGEGKDPLPNPLQRGSALGDHPLLVKDLPGELDGWLRALEGQPLPTRQGWKATAVAAPLEAGTDAWGGVLFLHDELDESHLDVLSLFALQLGSAMDVAEQYRRLDESAVELARTQAELLRHEHLGALGQLAEVMAHQVRNPLAAVLNSQSVLRRKLQPTGEVAMLLDVIKEEADRLDRIVGDLLDFVKPYELKRRPLQLEPLVAQVLAEATDAARAVGVKVAQRFARDLPAVSVDDALLKKALANLAFNAVQAMPRGGTLSVVGSLEPRAGGAWLRLDFKDQGTGLDSRAKEKLFQPFFTTRATGTGLGLAVVKRIVDEHAGEVSASNNHGGGATFTVKLPPASTREPNFTPPSAPAAPPVR